MKKTWNFVLNGYVRLVFPLIICVILVEKVLHILNPLIHQIKDKLHITRLVGVLDVFLVSLVLLLLLGFLCGLLLKSKFISDKIKSIETGILRKIPLYSELKSMLSKSTTEQDTENYLPALLKEDERYSLGYITDQSQNFYTIVICDTSLHGGELRIVPKGSVKLLNIPFYEFARSIRAYGANAAHFAEKEDEKAEI